MKFLVNNFAEVTLDLIANDPAITPSILNNLTSLKVNESCNIKIYTQTAPIKRIA